MSVKAASRKMNLYQMYSKMETMTHHRMMSMGQTRVSNPASPHREALREDVGSIEERVKEYARHE
jgi:hypothetical protein